MIDPTVLQWFVLALAAILLGVSKTGLPGVAWLKLDAKAQWPANLAIKVPE